MKMEIILSYVRIFSKNFHWESKADKNKKDD